MASTTTPTTPSYATPEDFLADLRTTLLDDPDALVDWQIRIQDTPPVVSSSRFCFRVRLPGVAGTDMVSGEPPDPIPEVEGEIEGPPTCVEDMEDFCPITYLAYRKGLGCYAVDKVRLAARQLGLSLTQTEVLIAVADSALPANLLYQALQAIFVQKEDQHVHGEHMRVLAEARAILDS